MIVSRVDDSQIRTLHNVCRHRGTLISREDCGKARRLVCPYHQWTYERDCKLASCRGMHDEINQDELGLLLAHLEDLEGMLFVSLAETPERAQELTDLIEMGRSIDFDIRPIAIDELAERMPHMRTDDLTEACWCPTDDHLQPAELAGAFHKVGRDHGVRYETNCPVTGVLLEGNQARGVQTPKGEFHAPILVNAAGPWSHLVAGLTDTTLPTAALGHVYLTTQPHPDHPVDRRKTAVCSSAFTARTALSST